MIVNLSDAKTNLSRLVDLAHMGEEIVIAKNNLPLVDLVPHRRKARRVLGRLSGTFTVPENFNDEDPEVNKLFYGGDA
jgi:prevent-host-death family protein